MNEQEIPIDIHLNKLLDWLISRRHCNRDWQKAVLSIRKKINDAIQDMPAVDEITNLLVGTYINYFHCVRIVEILKDTEASSKNIFGWYSSQRMKDWQDIVELYQKDSVYLAEVAQMLMRNVNYEIPSLKKQILKCCQLQEECLKREADYSKSASDMKEKYYASCSQIGIQGKCIKKELLSLLDDLPETFAAVASSVKSLQFAREYYLSFLNFTMKRDFTDSCLPVLTYLMMKGNTSMYEYRTGEQPEVVEVTQPILPLDVDNGSIPDDQIDFGEAGVTAESGDDRSSSSPNGDFVHVETADCKAEIGDQIDFGDNDADINWDINVEISSENVLEGECEGGKVARGEDALSVLENATTRNLFYNELLELDGFLEQRLVETQSSDDVLSSNQFQLAPPSVQLQSSDNIKHMLETVKSICSQLMSTKLKHLYMIKESPKYVDRLTETLKSKLDVSEKMHHLERAMCVRYHEAVEEQKDLEPKLRLIVDKTKELQSMVENAISKKYKNRPVNIMGVATGA